MKMKIFNDDYMESFSIWVVRQNQVNHIFPRWTHKSPSDNNGRQIIGLSDRKMAFDLDIEICVFRSKKSMLDFCIMI